MINIKLFNIPVSELKGVGKCTEDSLKKLNVTSIGSLITLFPNRYENWKNIQKVRNCIGKTSVIQVRVTDDYSCFVSGSGKKIYKVKCIDANHPSDLVNIVFFNTSFIASTMKKGEFFLVMGEPKQGYGGAFDILSPKVKPIDYIPNLDPIYPQVKGITSEKIKKIMMDALNLLPEKINETIPEKFLDKFDLPSLDFSIRNIHFPKSEEDMFKSQKRINFEELLTWVLSMKKSKEINPSKFMIKDFSKDFFKLLDFELTNSQKKAIEICSQDMASEKTMSRMLQGDVGSGKTVVSMALAFNVLKSGYQVAIMAPTEVLAVQHYESFSEIIGQDNISIICGSTKKKEKENIILKFKEGIPGILIGTHALTSDGVEFKNLALTITDEQHKFGVEQRLKLVRKGDNPHNLVMSATPIPRSLAMILYGDMDLCVIDEMPKGRKQIKTKVLYNYDRIKAFYFMKKKLLEGDQIYIVCPKVGLNDEFCDDNNVNVEGYQENIMCGFFDEFNVATLHGKMSSDEKDFIIRQFAAKQIDILISTTVIEVGINVPNATVILIENAEKFGLASLHQMRGRVGRGSKESYCILICNGKSDSAIERLQSLEESSNGFYLAQKDLETRGPGDFLGVQQHGKLSISVANSLKDPKFLSQVKEFSDFIDKTNFKFRSISNLNK